ncbi:hypothetical protein SY83_16545 [Paenibacillus swuensis]|uniref:Copper amine oxidase-like N-terminal domain-containing protein n=1 Tax=Paenibacillus swuensis TaxID=1178515 RepID=A0A172TKX7_9BACL|nr:hypothetical protein [Paenibacillus swuensis]ANE47626.1 hypothetical protein SY83_16545 [Paenibacillus swuensis]
MKKLAAGLAALTLLFANTAAATEEQYVPVKPSPNVHTAYIEQIPTQNGKAYVVADYIEWYEGASADRIFMQNEPDSGLDGAPDGYYIVNDNTKLRKLTISPNAEVIMQFYNRTGNIEDAEIVLNERISLTKFRKLMTTDETVRDFPYHLVVKNGVVVKIIQQFIP